MGGGLPALVERAVEPFAYHFPTFREVVMSTSKPRSENASCPESPHCGQREAEENGRDARGRFTPNNAGGPGNPFARRVAGLRKVLLEAVSDEDLRVVAEQLVVKAKMGDLAATKLLFQYVLGRAAATVDPDTVDVEEVELYKQAPAHAEVTDILRGRVGAGMAAEMLRLAVPRAGAGFAETVREALEDPAAFWRAVAGLDGWDQGDEGDQGDEAMQGGEAVVSNRAGMSGGECQSATRPLANGQSPPGRLHAPLAGKGDNQSASVPVQSRKRQGPRGA
jgi:hypothetical protein